MASKGKLSSSQLVNKLGGVVDANTVVCYYSKSVIEQTDIKLTALENLPAHQKQARTHAQYWRDSVEPQIQQCVTDTKDFSKAFLGKYDTLQSLIDQMKNGNQQAKDEFTTTIGTLVDQLDIVVSHTKDVTTKVGQFSSMLDQDTRNFRSDSEEAQKKIIGSNGELKALQDQLDAINSAIDRDRSLIARGFLTIWLAAAGAGIELKQQEDAKKDVQLKLAIERQELIALNAAKTHIDGFVNSMSPVSSAVTTLEGEWASLKSDFEEVTNELKTLSTTGAANYLGPLLETAKKDWNAALDIAGQLQSEQLQQISF